MAKVVWEEVGELLEPGSLYPEFVTKRPVLQRQGSPLR